MGKIRIGVIGLGTMGSAHAALILEGKIPDAQLTAVADVDDGRIAWAQARLRPDIQTFRDAESLLSSGTTDAVLISTPHYSHPPLAIEAFKNGLHVMIEKPAGVYTKQVREMNEAAAKSESVFGIMFQKRADAQSRQLKALVSSGELGEIFRTHCIVTDWFRAQSYYDSGSWRATWTGEGGGVLMNQCPHNLDLWQWTCGMPKRVRAFCKFGKYHDIEVEDDVTAYVEYENGATGLFVATTGEAPGTDRLEIAADRGKVVVENGKIRFSRVCIPVRQFTREYQGGFGKPDTWACDIPVPAVQEGHHVLTRNWVASIREGTPLIAPGEEGIHSLELANAMLLSSWVDDWVEIPVDEDLYFEKLKERIDASAFDGKAGEGRILNVYRS